MNLSELAQKNRRLKFWKETLKEGSLTADQKVEFGAMIKDFHDLLISLGNTSDPQIIIIPEVDMLKMVNLESKLEQLAEAARFESGRSTLL